VFTLYRLIATKTLHMEHLGNFPLNKWWRCRRTTSASAVTNRALTW